MAPPGRARGADAPAPGARAYTHRAMGEVRTVIGFMTGTSMDAVDAAALRVTGRGLELGARVESFVSIPLGELGDRLRRATADQLSAAVFADLALELGQAHAAAFEALGPPADRPSLAGATGQTLFHDPPRSLQLLNPWPLALLAGCPVVTDLRSADLAAGGEGAPITPLADWVLFRSDDEHRAIVNLGGFCNATLLPAGGSPGDVRGADVCACNQVLDAAARRALRAAYDDSGAAATRGEPDRRAVEDLADRLAAQRESERSLGTGDEVAGWVAGWGEQLGPDDLCASAAAGVGRAIGAALREAAPGARVAIAGGGARNAALVRAIAGALDAEVGETDALGVESRAREAACVGVLAALAADGVPISLPRVTGVPKAPRSAGAWVNVGTGA